MYLISLYLKKNPTSLYLCILWFYHRKLEVEGVSNDLSRKTHSFPYFLVGFLLSARGRNYSNWSLQTLTPN